MIEWFYGREGQQYGPIDEATLRARIVTGEVGPDDLVWHEGMGDWKPLREVPDFQAMPVSNASQDMGAVPTPDSASSPYAPPVSSPVGTHPVGPPAAVTNGLAIASLVCGILAVCACSCGIVLGIPAIICGHLALNQLKAPGNQQQGRGLAIAGLICGYFSILIFVGLMILGGIGQIGGL